MSLLIVQFLINLLPFLNTNQILTNLLQIAHTRKQKHMQILKSIQTKDFFHQILDFLPYTFILLLSSIPTQNSKEHLQMQFHKLNTFLLFFTVSLQQRPNTKHEQFVHNFILKFFLFHVLVNFIIFLCFLVIFFAFLEHLVFGVFEEGVDEVGGEFEVDFGEVL